MIFAGVFNDMVLSYLACCYIKICFTCGKFEFESMPFSLSHSSFFLPPRRSPDMTGILLTGMLNLNSTNQSK